MYTDVFHLVARDLILRLHEFEIQRCRDAVTALAIFPDGPEQRAEFEASADQILLDAA